MLDRDADNLAARVYATLGSEILTGRMAAGAKLVEESLSERLGVSRGPVREAIRRLQQRGLVICEPNVGARVASFSRDDMLSLYSVREALEGMAVRLATAAIDDEELDQLGAILDRMASRADHDDDLGFDGDLDFHARIARASGNPFLTRFLCEDLYALFLISRNQNARATTRRAQALQEHRLVLAAIRSRDPDLAEHAMRRHIANSRAFFEAETRVAEPLPPATRDRAARHPVGGKSSRQGLSRPARPEPGAPRRAARR
ncbi:MAG: GntR family transcriptional regulator [Ectothiorhodospiraceae bacterium]|nr:GntR family transcriptional regulator [Chromatiales bacterium]MCP5155967.1 GntR family transcriptional regulator [Ectothiorhodospiraceae bacterium]